MGLSKRLKSGGFKGIHPLAEWKSDAERTDSAPVPVPTLACSARSSLYPRKVEVDVDAPEGVTRKPYGFYMFDGAWARYGEGLFPDVKPPPGNRERRKGDPPREVVEEPPKPLKTPPVDPAPHVPLPGQLSFLEPPLAETSDEWKRKSRRKRDASGQRVFFLEGAAT